MATTFGANITIDGSNSHLASPAKYQAAVKFHLDRLKATATGRAVLREVTRPLLIRPWKPDPGESPNAYASADDFLGGSTPYTEVRSCGDGSVLSAGVKGRGTGSDVTVAFTPKYWNYPDNILLHELVHGIRIMRGVQRCIATADHFDTMEEVIAISVTNVYRSERGATVFRRDHHGFQWITKKDAYKLMKKHDVHLARVWFEQQSFARAMWAVKTGFNPFRDL